MNLKNHIEHLAKEDLVALKFDLFISASGYEARSTHLASSINLRTISNKLNFSFDSESKAHSKSPNDQFFQKNKFFTFSSNGNDETIILDALQQFFSKNKGHSVNVLIDYSCMTRVWYASILNFFRFTETVNYKQVHLYYAYSAAQYVSLPETEDPNTIVGPISGFSSLSIPTKPTALVIGIGYERERAFGLTEYLDAETYIFHTDPGANDKYSIDAFKNNAELLETIPPDNIFTYRLDDPKYLQFILLNLCQGLLKRCKVVLAPCGPKPFALLSMLISINNPGVDVWRISAGSKAKPTQKKALGPIYITKCSFYA